MEENIKQPQSTDDPQGPESGQQPEEIIPPEEIIIAAEKSEINNQKSEIENMEVHHHPRAERRIVINIFIRQES